MQKPTQKQRQPVDKQGDGRISQPTLQPPEQMMWGIYEIGRNFQNKLAIWAK
jgi:hypothetical protein